MSKKKGARPQPAKQPSSPARPLSVEVRPTIEIEAAPPPIATHFWITGGPDTFVVEFFYLDDDALTALLLDGQLGEGMEQVKGREDLVRVRRQPVARVALPLRVSMDVVARLFRFTVQGLPGLVRHLTALGEELQQAAVLAQELDRTGLSPHQTRPQPESHATDVEDNDGSADAET